MSSDVVGRCRLKVYISLCYCIMCHYMCSCIMQVRKDTLNVFLYHASKDMLTWPNQITGRWCVSLLKQGSSPCGDHPWFNVLHVSCLCFTCVLLVWIVTIVIILYNNTSICNANAITKQLSFTLCIIPGLNPQPMVDVRFGFAESQDRTLILWWMSNMQIGTHVPASVDLVHARMQIWAGETVQRR